MKIIVVIALLAITELVSGAPRFFEETDYLEIDNYECSIQSSCGDCVGTVGCTWCTNGINLDGYFCTNSSDACSHNYTECPTDPCDYYPPSLQFTGVVFLSVAKGEMRVNFTLNSTAADAVLETFNGSASCLDSIRVIVDGGLADMETAPRTESRNALSSYSLLMTLGYYGSYSYFAQARSMSGKSSFIPGTPFTPSSAPPQLPAESSSSSAGGGMSTGTIVGIVIGSVFALFVIVIIIVVIVIVVIVLIVSSVTGGIAASGAGAGAGGAGMNAAAQNAFAPMDEMDEMGGGGGGGDMEPDLGGGQAEVEGFGPTSFEAPDVEIDLDFDNDSM